MSAATLSLTARNVIFIFLSQHRTKYSVDFIRQAHETSLFVYFNVLYYCFLFTISLIWSFFLN